MDEPATDTGGGLIRLRMDVQYNGTGFHGWARQPAVRTVQAALEQGLSTVLRGDVELTVAGRTDAGVHATGQVVHVDVPAMVWAEQGPKLLRRLRGVLPPDIAVRAVTEAHPAFDARFGALARHYVYRLTDDPAGPSPLRRADTAAWPRRLDAAAMDLAAALLLGQNDFAAYCRRREGATTIRTLLRLTAARHLEDDGSQTVRIDASADAFCHSMVRSLVGGLIAVGEGRRPLDWPASLLSRTERSSEVPVAPAHGLTLVAVDYPPDADLAARTEVTRARRA
ncbi:tRNA pseudouridine(38-40) synthase TruA [Blastococcus capsensis]|uniref:tRNA pseudouridine(38-40) synthase TruA n=1 Tax=Blastococcus capsensis TaxID=1564163 RepID=UPI00253FCEC0|nr:tRNA pseudouridine(38-40) synthase TruA [Blastococcus capsensis]MDK3256267.1 tRNA pseudouridine(38-40) synthase TruA [Blastococcus capsensis]